MFAARMLLRGVVVAALVALGACSPVDPQFASDAAISQARYVAEGPTTVTLYTVVNNRSNAGAHSGLLINASEQVIFDPAGSWYHPRLPERGDVHHGVNARMAAFYIDYHARKTYRVVEQTVVVPPQTAELVLRRAEAYGSVPKTQCAESISTVLRDVPGFEGIPATWFPKKLSSAFASLPGATYRVVTDDDADKNHGVLIEQSRFDP